MLKLNKRVTLSVAGLLSLGALATIIGTTAFFKETKSTTNTFTVGSVEIELTEKQRGTDPTSGAPVLVDFVQEKAMLPIVGSEGSSNLDSLLLPSTSEVQNYVDKVVTITNTGKSDAYIRAYVAIPAKLDDEVDASQNILHFNFGRNSAGQKTNDSGSGDWLWKDNGSWNASTHTIPTAPLASKTTITDDVNISYNIYHADYKTSIAKDAVTERLLNGLYLDTNITKIENDANGNTHIILGNTDTDLGYNVDNYGIRLPIYVVAVQADGYANAKAAMTAAGFNYDTNPWTRIAN